MNNNLECFNKEFKLFDLIANLEIKDNKVLVDCCNNIEKINILEIYKPHLILYVFPSILNTNKVKSFLRVIKIFLKIVLNNKETSNELKHTPLKSDTNIEKRVGLINFNNTFYNESLKKLQECNDNNISYSVIEKHFIAQNIKPKNNNKKFKLISFQVIIALIKNHNKIVNHIGNYNIIELYIYLYYFFNIIISQNDKLFLNIDNNLLSKYDIIISNDFAEPITRYLLLISKSLGIKTLLIQHGLTSMSYPEWKFNFTDYTIVSGEEIKKQIQFQNPGLKNIIVTGVPNFDLTKNHVVTKNKPKYDILLTTQPFFPCSFHTKSLRRQIFFSIISESIKNKKINLTIKPHPSEPIYFYKLISIIFKNIKIENNSFMNILRNYDILITSFSQTSIYSNLIGIPTLNVYYGSNKCHLDFIYSGANILISSKNQLNKYLSDIESILNYNYDSDILYPWIHYRDSNSTKRINQILNEL
jgi:hypothetical protein